MKEKQRILFVSLLLTIAVFAVLFFLLYHPGGGLPDIPNDPKDRQAAGDQRAAQLGTDTAEAPAESETAAGAENGEAGDQTDPGDAVLTGIVYGKGGPVPGATVMAFPFALVKELIKKYESISIGGLGDIPGLIRQVKVDLYSLRTQLSTEDTDAEGMYAFYTLSPGEYIFVVTAPAHIFSYGNPTTVEEELCRRHDFTLKPGKVIAGKVVDPSGAPVAGASVLSIYQVQGLGAIGKYARKLFGLLNGEFLKGPFQAVTAADGSFTINTLPPGLYEINVTAERFAEASVPNIATGTKKIVIQLGPGGTVSGRLMALSGSPAFKVEVRLVAAEDKLSIPIPLPVEGVDPILERVRRFIEEEDVKVQSGADGRFLIERIQPGTYELVVDAAEFLETKRYFTITDNEKIDLGDIALDRGASIQGRVVDKEGSAVEGAVVSAQGEGGKEMEKMLAAMLYLSGKHRALTGPDGKFTIYGLDRDQQAYRVVASKAAAGMGVASSVRPDAAEPVEIVLEEPWRLAGTVVRAEDSKPLEGAEVYGGGAQTQTDEEGRFVLEPVLPDGNQLLFGSERRNVRIFARYPGFSPRHEFVFEEQLSEEITIELRSEPLIEGVVYTPDGRTKGGALVRLVPGRLPPVGGLDMITFAVTFTDRNGGFSFGDLRYGMECKAVASFPGFASGESQRFSVRPDEKVDTLEIELIPACRITGLVTDGKAPVSGVKLRLHQRQRNTRNARVGMFLRMFNIPEAGETTYTDNEGNFSFDDVAPGEWAVTATAGPSVRKSVDLNLVPEQEAYVEIELDMGGEIRGVVHDRGDLVVPLAEVRLLEGGNKSLLGLQKVLGGAIESRTTDQFGEFVFSRVKAGSYTLVAEKKGFAPAEVENVRIDSGVVEVLLEQESAVAGEVRMAGSNELVTSYTVRLDKPGKKTWNSPLKGWNPVNEPDGCFFYEGLEAGTYLVEVRSEGAAPGVAEVSVKSGEEVFVEIKLEAPGTISGHVFRGEEQTPVVRARVSVVSAEPEKEASSSGEAVGNFFTERMKEIATETADDGSFTLRDVSAGRLTIEATHDDYLPGRVTVTVEGGGEADCTIVLREGYALTGVVYSFEGVAAPQRAILVQGPDNIEKMERTGRDGTFTFNGLKPGKYRIWCPTPDLSRDMNPAQVDLEGDTSGVSLTLPPPPDQIPEDVPADGAAGESLPGELPAGLPEDAGSLRPGEGIPPLEREKLQKNISE